MSEHRVMRSARRLSQSISEGDGISVLVPVDDVEAARAAEAQGAEGVVLLAPVSGIREAVGLPILWGLDRAPEEAESGGADAYVLVVEDMDDDGDRLAEQHEGVQALGLESVVEVRDEEELELALDRVDPEIFLLSGQAAGSDELPLDRVLDLLPDVPAGKLAIARCEVRDREDVLALERAGVDAVIVSAGDVRDLVG